MAATTRGPRQELSRWHAAGIQAVEPGAAIRRACRLDGDRLCLGERVIDLRQVSRLLLVGGGKASAPMAAAIEQLLGDRIEQGLVVVKDGHTCPTSRVRLHQASHPVPDQRGAEGAAAILQLLAEMDERDLVINCLSGGASALLPAPNPPMTLADKQALTDRLLATGCDIHAINTVRRHVSAIKGGGLARATAPAALVNLLISDVIGDSLEAIGSGPGVPDPTSVDDARAVLNGLAPLPGTVLEALRETPKPGDACFQRVSNHIVASNQLAQDAVAAAAEADGWRVQRWSAPISGEASEAMETLLAFARIQHGPCLLLAGGETTVTLGGHGGRGGRCQTMALSAARLLHEQPDARLSVLAAGTDGNDGPTDAGGAFADAQTWQRISTAGLDPAEHLRRNDEYPALAAADQLLITGPTNTNVMDLVLIRIDAS